MASWSHSGLHIWTDGSVIKEYGGCSFVVLDFNNHFSATSTPLGMMEEEVPHPHELYAELFSIAGALVFAASCVKDGIGGIEDVVIYTDCKSALDQILDYRCEAREQDAIGGGILDAENLLRKEKVRLGYRLVKGHQDKDTGNDWAHAAAQAGAIKSLREAEINGAET